MTSKILAAIRLPLALSLLLAPFAVATGVLAAVGGWWLPIAVWAATAAVCACVVGGIYLLNKAEGVR